MLFQILLMSNNLFHYPNHKHFLTQVQQKNSLSQIQNLKIQTQVKHNITSITQTTGLIMQTYPKPKYLLNLDVLLFQLLRTCSLSSYKLFCIDLYIPLVLVCDSSNTFRLHPYPKVTYIGQIYRLIDSRQAVRQIGE